MFTKLEAWPTYRLLIQSNHSCSFDIDTLTKSASNPGCETTFGIITNCVSFDGKKVLI